MSFHYTLYLSTDDVRVAHHLAYVINQKGQKVVSAKGKDISQKAAVVIEVNDWKAFPLLRILENIKAVAKRFDVVVTGGSLDNPPLEALLEVSKEVLLLDKLPACNRKSRE
ncbi:MAG: hypothetical protein PWP31_587 [Clostridia bacterium]|nr:hypothetical protein [Clostridia bacterium]